MCQNCHKNATVLHYTVTGDRVKQYGKPSVLETVELASDVALDIRMSLKNAKLEFKNVFHVKGFGLQLYWQLSNSFLAVLKWQFYFSFLAVNFLKLAQFYGLVVQLATVKNSVLMMPQLRSSKFNHQNAGTSIPLKRNLSQLHPYTQKNCKSYVTF